MDGVDEVRLADAGPGRDRRPRRGRRASAAGTSGPSATRSRRSCGGDRRPTTRPCAQFEAAGGAGRRRTATAAAAAPASIHDVVRVKEPGLADAPRLRRPRAPLRARPVPRARRHGRRLGAAARDGELGDAVDGAFELVDARARAGSSPRRDGHDRRAPAVITQDDPDARRRPARPDAGPRGRARAPRRTAARCAARPRVDDHDARRRRQPVGLVGRRRARGPATTAPARRRASTPIAPGQRLRRRRGRRRRPTSRADAWWAPIETVSNSEAGFERVYQGSGLLLSWPVRLAPGERWSRTVAARRATTGRGTGADGADVVSRPRVSRPAPRRPRPLLPAAAPTRSPGTSRRPDRGAGRDWNERISAECYRPNAELGNLGAMSWDLGPTLAGWLQARRPDRLSRLRRRATAAANGMAQPFHHAILPLASAADRRTEIRWGLRDFELRFGRARRGMWLPETAVDLATLRLLADDGHHATRSSRRGRSTGSTAARSTRGVRYRVDLGGGRSIVAVLYDGLLSAAVSRSSRRRPPTRTGSSASASCRGLPASHSPGTRRRSS